MKPGQLIHADKHGFLVVPEEDQKALLDAATFMDTNECNTVIAAARSAQGKSNEDILESLEQASEEFRNNAAQKFSSAGEW